MAHRLADPAPEESDRETEFDLPSEEAEDGDDAQDDEDATSRNPRETLVAASAPGSFYSHYFIPAIPPCILAIAAFGADRRVTVQRAALGVVALFFAAQTAVSAVRNTSLTRAFAPVGP